MTVKVLAIGKSGQLAAALRQSAAATGLDLITSGRPDLDICDPASIAGALQAHNPAVVINAAAYTAVDEAQKNPAAAFAVNRDGAGHAAKVCASAGIPLIHISTDYVFNGHCEHPYREQDAASPLNVYGASKLAGEMAVRNAQPEHLILRTSWVFSPFGGNFVRNMLRLAETRDRISVVCDQQGSPTYAIDLANVVLQLAEWSTAQDRKDFAWGTYHVAGSGFASWHEVACQTFLWSGRSGYRVPTVSAIPSRDYPTPAVRPMNSRLDCSKLKKAFALQLPDWRDGVRRCVQDLTQRESSSQGGTPQEMSA